MAWSYFRILVLEDNIWTEVNTITRLVCRGGKVTEQQPQINQGNHWNVFGGILDGKDQKLEVERFDPEKKDRAQLKSRSQFLNKEKGKKDT